MRRLAACLVALALVPCLATVRVLVDTTVFSDTFTGAGNSLAATTPTVGTAWVLDQDTSSGTNIANRNGSGWANFIATSATTGILVTYRAQGTTTFTDGYVEATTTQINDASADDFLFWRIRRTASDTYLGCGWYAASVGSDTYCFKVVSGTYTQLANGDCGFVDGSVARVTVTGDTISITKDGSACSTPVSGTGANAVAGPGDGGFGMGALRVTTDDVTGTGSPQIDNFSVVSQDAVVSRPGGFGSLFKL